MKAEIRKLESLELEVTLTREFHVRVAVALWLIRCAARILGGRIKVTREEKDAICYERPNEFQAPSRPPPPPPWPPQEE